ncbi:MAG: sigma-54 interaction domain-containing protein [Peptococcaceae bacterium]
MTGKKIVYFMATNDFSCEVVKQQLEQYLGNYIEVKTWHFRNAVNVPTDLKCDLCLASGPALYDKIKEILPADTKVLIANRTLEIDNLDELLTLKEGTEVLVVSSWEETANEKITLLNKLGFGNLIFYPYWRGLKSYPKHIKYAITTGRHLVPPQVGRVINVGVRVLDLSTFVELIVELDLPKDIIDEISQHYLRAIINLVTKRLQISEQSENLKRRLQVILETVDQATIAVDENKRIMFINPAAEKLLNTTREQVLDSFISDFLTAVDFETILKTANNLEDSIVKIHKEHFIVNINPIDNSHNIIGAVITLKPIKKVQELDTKVRRELRRKGYVAKYTFPDIVGESSRLIASINMAKRFAVTDLSILIDGESGTGKELFAQSIHNFSARSTAPFVATNFAAIPSNLVESELFGYEEGAFTGARKGGKPGLFEEGHTGTIFLDEIGDASLEVQKKLLRVLEEKEVRRVGGNIVTPVDVRIIAATNKNLRELTMKNKFREDLFYRLCTIQLSIPALRDRKEDILELINLFAAKYYKRRLFLEDGVKEFLINYNWPGNVRELQNVVQFMCGMVEPGEKAIVSDLPGYLFSARDFPENDQAYKKANEKLEVICKEIERRKIAVPVHHILNELRKVDMINKGLGRQSLLNIFSDKALNYPDHKVRTWLKFLNSSGCITVGTTKQGSKITPLGKELLVYLEKKI